MERLEPLKNISSFDYLKKYQEFPDAAMKSKNEINRNVELFIITYFILRYFNPTIAFQCSINKNSL